MRETSTATAPAKAHEVRQQRSPRIAIVHSTDFGIWQPRRGLVALLIGENFDVDLMSAQGAHVKRLESLGARHVPLGINRFVNPASDLQTMFQLVKLFNRGRYDIVQTFGTKMNILGAIAAKLAGVPHIVIDIEGAGYGFGDHPGLKAGLIRSSVANLYRVACRCANVVRFLQYDDLALFQERGILRNRRKAVVLKGDGVNPEEYRLENFDPERQQELRQRLGGDAFSRFVVMLSRAIWSKGVREFIEAAENVHARQSDVRFVLVGFPGEGPDAIPESYLHAKKSPAFEWLGFWPDIREVLAIATVAALPTYLREGLPGALVEALWLGKPLVVTDNVGCRETVDDGVNGFLVPVRDAGSLAAAIERLISDERLLAEFGHNSLMKARSEFDERVIYRRYLTELYQLQFDPVAKRWKPK